jgi:hypothetical protein
LKAHVSDPRGRYPLFGAYKYPRTPNVFQTYFEDDEGVISCDAPECGAPPFGRFFGFTYLKWNLITEGCGESE